MKKLLTAKSIEAFPAAIGKRYEVHDHLLPGLHLRVSSTGGKVFYLSKRIDRKMCRIKIGTWPIITLHSARDQARTILNEIELGQYVAKTPRQEARPTPTLGDVIPQFIDRYARTHTKDWKGTRSILTKFASLNSRPIDQIKRVEIVHVLDEIIASGATVRANRALAAIKKLMNWCIDRGIIETSPVASLKPPTKEVSRDRVLTDDELAACWRAGASESYPFAQFLQILILTGQRRGEVSNMRWSEIDLEKGMWTLPGKRTKNSATHIVPLAPLAVETLKSMPRFLDSDFVFTTRRTSPISGFGRLKERLDCAMEADTQDWRFHDLRRTMATNMAMMGIQPHIIEAVLNHKSGVVSGVAAVYNRHAYMDEKRHALEAWAEYVGELTKNFGEYVTLRRSDHTGLHEKIADSSGHIKTKLGN